MALPQKMKDLIEQYVQKDTHLNLSEFVRDAIREKLKRDAPHLCKQLFVEETAF